MQTLLYSEPQFSDEVSWNIRNILNDALSDLKTVGFTSFPGLILSTLVSELHAEAVRNKKNARSASSTSGHGYRAHLSGLGEAGRAFLAGRTMTALNGALFRMPLAPDKLASCYTYYQPGDFLGAHVDHPEQCSVTAILYLDVVCSGRNPARTGLELHVLGAAPSEQHCVRPAIIPTRTGSLVLGVGSVYWHERPMLQDGEYVTAMTACYSVPRSG